MKKWNAIFWLAFAIIANLMVVASSFGQDQQQAPKIKDVSILDDSGGGFSADAFLRLRTDRWNIVSREAEVRMASGDNMLTVYGQDTGNLRRYQEAGAGIGRKLLDVGGLELWFLASFVGSTQGDYAVPTILFKGKWEKWACSSLFRYSVPLNGRGNEHFDTVDSYLNYNLNEWLQVGIGGQFSWINEEDSKTQEDDLVWRVGPNFTLKNPIELFGGTGWINIRPAYESSTDWSILFQPVFSFR